MKFLADVGVSGATVRALRELDHDAAHLVALGLERLSDAEILARAAREQRVILTFDLDFGDLLAQGRSRDIMRIPGVTYVEDISRDGRVLVTTGTQRNEV